MSDKWITEELESSDVGSYMGVPRNLLPEIFFEEELPAWEELHPRGGCRGLEVRSYSSSHMLPNMEKFQVYQEMPPPIYQRSRNQL